MAKSESVISLDPIDRTRKKQDGIISRLFKTRHYGGHGISKEIPYGHYMFCGSQGSGKTASMVWYYDFLIKKFEKRGYKVVNVFSNFGIGDKIDKNSLFKTIYDLESIQRTDKKINFILIDEIQGYFPKDFADKATKDLIGQLTQCFSQLRKRHVFLLSTAQVYGRLDKNLREQCLYMVQCRKSHISNKIVNDFIPADNIMCDDLGRWGGIPDFIYVHGLSKVDYDSSLLIKS